MPQIIQPHCSVPRGPPLVSRIVIKDGVLRKQRAKETTSVYRPHVVEVTTSVGKLDRVVVVREVAEDFDDDFNREGVNCRTSSGAPSEN